MAGVWRGILLMLASVSVVEADDIIRCRGRIVSEGMIASEVVALCGEPQSKQIEQVPIRARRANGSSQVIGTTEVEHWTYDRGTGQLPAVLTFEQGSLKKLELLLRR
jgi:Protein of unknown function (DUF2845)